MNERKHYIDNIRWVTVLLVVFYHVIYIYNGITLGGAGPFTGRQLQDAVQYALYPWFMVILFIVAGVSARAALETHTAKEFVKSRTQKLLVPSTVGLFVFQWIQGYISMSMGNAFDSIPPEVPPPVLYLIMVLSGTGVLWFVQMLWIFSMLLILVRKIDKNDSFYALCGKANVIVLILLGAVAFGAAQILNTPPVIPVYRFGIYGFSFFAGYFVFSHDCVVEKLSAFFIPFAIGAVLLGAVYVRLYFGENYAEPPIVNNPLAISYAWCMCLAMFGGFYRWLNKTNGFFQFMRKNSFSIYIFHYMPISAAALLLRRRGVSAVPSYLLVALAAAVGTFALSFIIPHIPVLRRCVLGISRRKTAVPEAS